MNPCEPTCPDTARYPIGKAAELLGIHRNTLRRYTDEMRIRCIRRPSGKTYYTGKELRRLWRTL